MTYILIFQVFKTSRQRQRKTTRLYEGTEKGWLKKTSKLLKRGWFGFFLNCTVLVNFFNKHYLLFDNNFYLCPKCLEKDSLSQHCSSVQFRHIMIQICPRLLQSVCPVDNCQLTLKAFQSLGIRRSGQTVAEKLRKGISLVLSRYGCDVTVRHQEAEILWEDLAASDSAASHCCQCSLGCWATVTQTACFSSSTVIVVSELFINTF